MKGIHKRGISSLLVTMMAITLFVAWPMTALSAPPDLDVTLVPGSGVSTTKIAGVNNAAAGTGFWIGYSNIPIASPWPIGSDFGEPGTHTIGADLSQRMLANNYYIVYEIDSASVVGKHTVVNYVILQANNDQRLKPTPGTTTIRGGTGKVTVSSYAAVSGCTLYLVPRSLYPAGGGMIDITNSNIKTVTGDGDITGLSSGRYALYTVYTGSISAPNHGAYAYGSEVVVARARPPQPIVWGDTDGNGSVSAADAALILRHLVRLETLSEEALTRANVTHTGTVSAADAAKILRFLVRLVASLEPG